MGLIKFWEVPEWEVDLAFDGVKEWVMMNGASLTNDELKGSFRNLKGDGAMQGPPSIDFFLSDSLRFSSMKFFWQKNVQKPTLPSDSSLKGENESSQGRK